MKMKIYTENDVKKAMLIYHDGLTIDYVMSKLKPIELPSDEDIEEKLGMASGGLFCKGAKWIINHIKQQVIS
jgi:hypothetical protein